MIFYFVSKLPFYDSTNAKEQSTIHWNNKYKNRIRTKTNANDNIWKLHVLCVCFSFVDKIEILYNFIVSFFMLQIMCSLQISTWKMKKMRCTELKRKLTFHFHRRTIRFSPESNFLDLELAFHFVTIHFLSRCLWPFQNAILRISSGLCVLRYTFEYCRIEKCSILACENIL